MLNIIVYLILRLHKTTGLFVCIFYFITILFAIARLSTNLFLGDGAVECCRA